MRWSVTLVLLAGCVDLNKEYADRRFHDLDVTRTGDAKTPAAGTVLKVRRFKVASRYEGTEHVMKKGAQYESDYYNCWFVPPGSMLTDETRAWLSTAGLFEHVVDFGSHLDATHVLEGNVSALYLDATDAPKSILEMQLFLMDDRETPATVAFRKTYRREIAGELVAGATRGLAEILAELEADVAQVKLIK